MSGMTWNVVDDIGYHEYGFVNVRTYTLKNDLGFLGTIFIEILQSLSFLLINN